MWRYTDECDQWGYRVQDLGNSTKGVERVGGTGAVNEQGHMLDVEVL